MLSANTTTSNSGSPYFKFQTPMSNLRPSPVQAVKPVAPLPPALLPPPTSSFQPASLGNGGTSKPVMMRAKFGRLPVISVNGSGHERLFTDDGYHRNEDGIDEEDDEDDDEDADSEDDAKLLETLSKVVTTKSLRLQRVTRLIESSQGAATTKIKARKEQKVFMRVVFLKVGEINTALETFTADMFVQARWREPLFDGKLSLNTEKVRWKKYWNPRLYVDNCVGDPKENVWYSVLFNSWQEAFVVERRRVKGTFSQSLQLTQFPFDTQEIEFRVMSELSDMEVILEEDSSELSTVNIQSFIDEQEWRLYRNVEVRRKVVSLVYTASDGAFKHPSFAVLCHASRRFGFYVWNIMFVMFFITSMSLCSFSVALVKPENRMQLTFILLLTTITFKFAVSSSLPRISYLTYLDNYILVSMCFMGLVVVWHSISPSVGQFWVDKGLLIGLALLFVTINVIFAVVIYRCPITKRNEFLEKERLHKRRIHIQQKIPDDQALRDVRATQLNVTMDSTDDIL